MTVVSTAYRVFTIYFRKGPGAGPELSTALIVQRGVVRIKDFNFSGITP